jgi:hypothetical protein
MRQVLLLFGLTLSLLLPSERLRAQGSASQAGYLYLSPVPDASYVPTQTRYILVRFSGVTPFQVSNLTSGFVTVTGASSGDHSGSTRIATDGRTVIFETGTDFLLNELVTVTLNPLLAPDTTGVVTPYQYQFRIEAPMPDSLPLTARPAHTPGPTPAAAPAPKPRALASSNAVPGRARPKAMVMPNGVSVPSDFPQVVITVNAHPSPGYLFLENALDLVPPYTMMLDNNGLPVWYHQGRMYDFKIQKNGSITWCLDNGSGFSAFDQNFNYLKTYVATNGYQTDGHDLKVLPDGRYFIIAYQNSPVDMSQYIQGASQATVTETVVQEFTAAD